MDAIQIDDIVMAKKEMEMLKGEMKTRKESKIRQQNGASLY